jgi:hypothetical protein
VHAVRCLDVPQRALRHKQFQKPVFPAS